MAFKKIAVLCDVYEMSKGRNIRVVDKVGEPFLTDRIFALTDANKRNSDYANKRRWVDIKWEETAKLQLEAGNLDWLDYVLEEKKLECKNLKRKIKFPVKDSYTEALEDGEEIEQKNDVELDEYVKSMYDYVENSFPKGETAVITSVQKKYGDNAVEEAQKVMVELLKGQDDEMARIQQLAGV